MKRIVPDPTPASPCRIPGTASRKIMIMKQLLIGIDVGSTTTKITVLDAATETLLYSDYRRHHADQLASVLSAVRKAAEKFSDSEARIILTGSGAKPVAEAANTPYIQEVVANSIALKKTYTTVGTAIELGGQDAKIIFFKNDTATGALHVADMRMNGSCAGGTGAFIDEVASILQTPSEDMNALASKGTCVYDISGRCGVYAKTDIQPLLNQGVAKADIALSSFHAIAKQTIGGLAQGLDIRTPVVFEGGPLTFNPKLIDVFSERLHLKGNERLVPEHPEIMVAYGAALSLNGMFQEKEEDAECSSFCLLNDWVSRLEQVQETASRQRMTEHETSIPPFFSSKEEYDHFLKEHPKGDFTPAALTPKTTVRAWLGIDSGSTTTKFVLMDDDEKLLDFFYASNQGDPLTVAKNALIAMRNRYRDAGVTLEILGCGSTGYGELLFSKAFSTEYHVVETVAHARAAFQYMPDITFLLDIGGQDMKAIWLDHGIITNILVNEACSSGCGSFLENFASTLKIPVTEIASAAFRSKDPAVLGSRCTVFMNSSIVTEQRNGKKPEDIMAGLCRSIIENVFTKVIRISNLDSLGDHIMVQGGTFRNDAVLRAFEQYTGKSIVRAPYPGMMGAIGAAILTKEAMADGTKARTFIGLDAMDSFSYTQEANAPCPFCTNHCKRTIVRFPNGQSWVTNNRCERGEVLGDPKDPAVQKIQRDRMAKQESVPNCYKIRESLLWKEYPVPEHVTERNLTIGIPRVLSFWETMPFWSTFFRSLGFKVRVSAPSSHKLYEEGLYAVASDTVCFPAKLVHGHIRSLAKMHVDRIFMPSITSVQSENKEKTSEWMCAIVKGYPLVIKNSDNPEHVFGIPFDNPLFHWYTKKDRDEQLTAYIKETYHVPEREIAEAIRFADAAETSFHQELSAAGEAILKQVTDENRYAVILASRPYQNDPLVNHSLPEMFTSLGIPVLTADAVPGVNEVDLTNSRLDVVNNYHARMLGSAVIAAENPHLEYVQIVSFGCGHDAYLSDEIIRLMKQVSGKIPLILKLDESEIQGPLRIRVRSFTETVRMQREKNETHSVHALSDPYPVKYEKDDRTERIVLVPNTSHAFCRVMSAAMAKQGLRAEPLPIGREEAIRLGKKYVHNDICFPAQIVIGEALAALKSGKYDGKHVAIATGKYIGDCRLTHYSALLRKALDDAGFSDVPILTNDDADFHNLHPGFRLSLLSALRIAYALPMIDILEELLRKIRPYELEKGSADAAFDRALDAVIDGLSSHGVNGAKRGFAKAIEIMKHVPYDRSHPRPTVLIVGEYLLNFHPGANHDIEAFLEQNGFEIIEARMSDVIQKSYFYRDMQVREYHLHKPVQEKLWYRMADLFFDLAHDAADKIARSHPLYDRPAVRLPELVKESDPIIHHTFDAGEGVLIPGEILHHAAHGCRAFVILQPFGCLPNHVVGRGISKRLKELYPDVQILPLDYDPDVSFANIENRLQMLIMNAREQEAETKS